MKQATECNRKVEISQNLYEVTARLEIPDLSERRPTPRIQTFKVSVGVELPLKLKHFAMVHHAEFVICVRAEYGQPFGQHFLLRDNNLYNSPSTGQGWTMKTTEELFWDTRATTITTSSSYTTGGLRAHMAWYSFDEFVGGLSNILEAAECQP